MIPGTPRIARGIPGASDGVPPTSGGCLSAKRILDISNPVGSSLKPRRCQAAFSRPFGRVLLVLRPNTAAIQFPALRFDTYCS
jgi:hypothetical protein